MLFRFADLFSRRKSSFGTATGTSQLWLPIQRQQTADGPCLQTFSGDTRAFTRVRARRSYKSTTAAGGPRATRPSGSNSLTWVSSGRIWERDGGWKSKTARRVSTQLSGRVALIDQFTGNGPRTFRTSISSRPKSLVRIHPL